MAAEIKRTTKKGRKIVRECPECGCLYETTASEAKRGFGRVCSRHCAGKRGIRRLLEIYDFTGENNPNYKGETALTNYQHKLNFRARHPEKALVHDITRRALRNGQLVRQACERCGATERIHAHHEDYSRPLDVTWLCDSCHRKAHGATR